MDKYIKLEDVLKILKEHRFSDTIRCKNSPAYNDYYVGAIDELDRVNRAIKFLPAADVAPVVHGYWEEIRDPYGKIEGWLCKCGREVKIKDDYCPRCGAKMDLEE